MRETLQAQLTATKRQHVLDAAARVFAEKGFHAATIKDVATAAGVAHGSIYTYFENKEALLLGLFDLMSAQARVQAAASGTPDDPDQLLRATVHQPLAALTSGNAELFRIIFSEALINRAFSERLRTQILEPMILASAELLKSTVFADAPLPPDFDLRVRAVSGLMLGTILQRVLHDDLLETRWDEMPALLVNVLLQGVKGTTP
ncbi:TetR/AcrR family transcriptional regulator [Deinococcus oregonensis]|uniref:TetR/AcrR family transcriptional regulator n=1 Tax=Deinococcus oregonensis TaxID=1805970 RepID=A0ABV6ATZ8_9DEIO